MKNHIEKLNIILKKMSSSSLIGPRLHSNMLAASDWLTLSRQFHHRHREKEDTHHVRKSWTILQHTSLIRHLWRNATSYQADALKI
jgi:hypothetical protein